MTIRISVDARYLQAVKLCPWCSERFCNINECRCGCHLKKKWGQVLQQHPELMTCKWEYSKIYLFFLINIPDGILIKQLSKYGFFISIAIPFLKKHHRLALVLKMNMYMKIRGFLE